jgi:hypothetical protein
MSNGRCRRGVRLGARSQIRRRKRDPDRSCGHMDAGGVAERAYPVRQQQSARAQGQIRFASVGGPMPRGARETASSRLGRTLNRLADIDRHPFFVFGKGRVRLLQSTEFARFIRRTRHVREQCPEFGCFRPVLLCGEHLKSPFCGIRSTIGRSAQRDAWVVFIGDERWLGRPGQLARSAAEGQLQATTWL